MKKVRIILLFAITLAGCIGTETMKTNDNLESKNKIKAKVSRETNYVYHMLSVAKCGYDNEYGNNYASYHQAEDLRILKDNENLITVKGGEHIGELYGLLVAQPAALDIEAAIFYESLGHLFEIGDFDENIQKYKESYKVFLSENEVQLFLIVQGAYNAFHQHREAIVMICDVMRRNYAIYCDKIWEKTNRELAPYAETIETIFIENNMSFKLETLTKVSLKNNFSATFVNSIHGGAEAIDISEKLDVFGAGRNYESAVEFISHEFVIYLLKQALVDTVAFTDLTYWAYTEGLAEFYIGFVGIGNNFFPEVKGIVEYYKIVYATNNHLSASELFLKAVEEFM
jgi:hypothetical protein